MRRIFLSFAAVAILLGVSAQAFAQTEVTLIAPGGIRAPIEKLIPGFEKKTGYKVNPTFGSGGGTKKQVISGDVFDVPIVQPPLAEVTASGNVVESTATPLASVAVGVAVKKGAPKPDISSSEAVKKMLLSAKSIVCPDATTGAAAGVSINDMLKKLGIDEQVEPKLKRVRGTGAGGAGGGTMVSGMIANGEAELGMTFVSEMTDPGIDVVGVLPKEVSPWTPLVGYISTHSKNPEAAKALLKYLSSPEALAAYKAAGMQPGK
ncbi:MAG TPA: substrate-binding domain-containing protein [Candidatus Acidoferrales bacterium]|jgi:molybdate transport system substrate-binding protein|nr:substrate-binding domain-containing protein [Candidatus Acidoferrales bacterium]